MFNNVVTECKWDFAESSNINLLLSESRVLAISCWFEVLKLSLVVSGINKRIKTKVNTQHKVCKKNLLVIKLKTIIC